MALPACRPGLPAVDWHSSACSTRHDVLWLHQHDGGQARCLLGPARPSSHPRLPARSYTKFLVGHDGCVYGRYLPRTRAAKLEPSIRVLLAAAADGDGSAEGAAVRPAGLAPAGGCEGGCAMRAWLRCRDSTLLQVVTPFLPSTSHSLAAACAGAGAARAVAPAVRPPEHGSSLGVLVDGLGREVRGMFSQGREDELLPSHREAAATRGCGAADKAALTHAAERHLQQEQRLPVLEQVAREPPGEPGPC